MPVEEPPDVEPAAVVIDVGPVPVAAKRSTITKKKYPVNDTAPHDRLQRGKKGNVLPETAPGPVADGPTICSER